MSDRRDELMPQSLRGRLTINASPRDRALK
jgi:hypothetical protein